MQEVIRSKSGGTVDAKNPKQPPGMGCIKTLEIVGETIYEVGQDFFHQQ